MSGVHCCVPSAGHSVCHTVATQYGWTEKMRMNISIIFFLIRGGEKTHRNIYDSMFEGMKDYGELFLFLIPETLCVGAM